MTRLPRVVARVAVAWIGLAGLADGGALAAESVGASAPAAAPASASWAAARGLARELVDFDRAPDPATSGVNVTDARVTLVRRGGESVWRVETGHREPWPGVTVTAPGGAWDLSGLGSIRVSLRNPGTNAVTVHGRVDNAGADGRRHCVTGSATVAPGREQELVIPLRRHGTSTLGGRLFGLRGAPAVEGGDGTVDPSRITQVLLFVHRPAADHIFEIAGLHAEGRAVTPTASVTDADPYFPCIDAFGQYRHRDWPGKVHSVEELRARREVERADLEAHPAPAAWNRYGGWEAGPQLEATGYFRTARHGGKWWLVDPDGRLFFSQGIDCVRMLDLTPIDGRESWFEAPPWEEPELAGFLVARAFALKGHYAGRSPRCFSFAGANLRRKHGAGWREVQADVIHQRLRSWGINTLGNWSDDAVRQRRRTPYTDSIDASGARWIEGSEGYWGKFPDPFDPGFRLALTRSMAGRKGRSAGDPWCIGFFSDNELGWGDELSLAVAAWRSPPDQPARRAFVDALRARHGAIERLNAAWGTRHASWDAAVAARDLPPGGRARADLEAFSSQLANEYFRVAREVVRAVAPRQLYLGCRFAWANPRAAAAAAAHCDVVSYNLYQRDISGFEFPGGRDVPLLVGEFHFGALDRGLFHPGLVPVADQVERAAAYAGYVRGALRHPQMVGTHWFQYQDEPTTGRVYDEENYQIGFVDIADTPYPELVAATRELAAELYSLRLAP